MASPDLSRRVASHDEDLRAISDTVIEIRDDVVEIKSTLAGHDTKLDDLGTEVHGLHQRIDGLDGRVDGLEREMREGFAVLGAGMERITALLTNLEGSRGEGS